MFGQTKEYLISRVAATLNAMVSAVKKNQIFLTLLNLELS